MPVIARDGHAECGEPTATNSSSELYEKQARLHAANAPLGEDEFSCAVFPRLRKLMQAPRRTANNAPIGPLLNAFFGWGVLPGTEVTIGKIALVSGKMRARPPSASTSDTAAESRQILVHVVREKEVWLVANIIYDSGKSLMAHYRGMAGK